MIKIYLKSFFLLPSTFLHELMHFVAAFLVGAKIGEFNIIPKVIRVDGGHYVILGSVDFIAAFKVFNFVIGLAPLFLWFMLWVILERVGVINGSFPMVSFDYIKLFDLNLWWVWIVSFYLIVGGQPSKQDLSISLDGFFSISGFVLCLFLGMIFYERW